jgi:hypothetical protein
MLIFLCFLVFYGEGLYSYCHPQAGDPPLIACPRAAYVMYIQLPSISDGRPSNRKPRTLRAAVTRDQPDVG